MDIGHFEKLRALAVGGRVLFLGGVRASTPSQVSLVDVVSNKPLAQYPVPSHVLGLAAAGASGLFAAACADGALRVGQAATGFVREVSAHAGACTAVAIAPDQDRALTVGTDGALRLWSLASGEKKAEWALSTQPLRAVAVDPAGEYAAAAGDDGVVRVITLATGARRDMAGHDGPVRALAFTPRDGRVVSAGDDGTLRFWYLVGAVEFETRGGDDSGHVGAVLSLVFPPTPKTQPDGTEPGDRVFSAGADGKVKVWRLDDRRKGRTLDAGGGAVYSLAFAPSQGAAAKNHLGGLFTGGDNRAVRLFRVDLAGVPEEQPTALHRHGFGMAQQALTGQKNARLAAVQTLAPLDEPEALELLLGALSGDKDAEVRLLVAQKLGEHHRRGARAALRERLSEPHAGVRRAALEALRTIDGETSLSPLRAALASTSADIRVEGLKALVPLRALSPLVPGLLAEKLTDNDHGVRLTALDQLSKLYAEGSAEPLRAAFERGPADLRVEVLIRAAFGGMVSAPTVAPMVSRALDDADAGVRRVAFAVKALERRALAHALEGRDEAFARVAYEIARRGAQLTKRDAPPAAQAEGKEKDKGPTEEEIKAARAALPGFGVAGQSPTEEDLEPLLTAVACRTPDTALRGARGLAQLGDTRALGALLQLSREADAGLRREAATALQELRDPRARKRLVWMLDDADATVRAAALEAFGRFEESTALAVAEASLRSAFEDVRVRGLDRLVKLGAEGKRTTEAETLLGDAIEDESPKVRSEAFRTLWAWHEKDPEKALDRALGARFPDLRQRAVTELTSQSKEHEWARERLQSAIGDRDAGVAQAAYEAVVKLRGEELPEPHLAAMLSTHAAVRTLGAKGASKAPVEKVRSALTKLLSDEDRGARTAALESLDKLLKDEAGPHYAALQGSHLDLRARSAELLATRHDEQLIEPMRALASDVELGKRIPPAEALDLRRRAASALATLGSPRTLKYFATELLKMDDAGLREQAARGLAMAARRGDEGYLLDALGHGDAWVRSWAADGLSRLGDVRALPVLTGNQKHEHLPIRLGAILSFAALGPEGYGGILQGLEDPSREVQELVFSIILARDLRAFRRGEAPDLLTSALSSQRPEVRFAAARALELRTDPESWLAHLIEVLMPPKPEKASGMKGWPSEESRGRTLVGLAEALASEVPEQRYAAAQVLNLRKKPLEYFREAQRVSRLRSLTSPWVPDTTPRAAEETDSKPGKGWLRRLYSGDGENSPSRGAEARERVPDAEQAHLRRLAFGAYVGLLRQVTAGDDEGHRTRRDAVDRIVDLGNHGDVGLGAAVPALSRALDDPHHLVRKAAFSGLKKLYAKGADEPLVLALASVSADVARAALDELAERGEAGLPRIAEALNSRLPDVRRYAFELMEKLSPKGSLEPLLAALGSEYSDLRVGVIERLADTADARVTTALCKAMESDHDDLRLRSSELLALRKDDRAVDVLSAFVRGDDRAMAGRAVESLVKLGTSAAVKALASRLEDASEEERATLVRALGRTRHRDALEALTARFEDESASVRVAALDAGMELAGRDRKHRDLALSLRALGAAVKAKDPALRLTAVNELDHGDDPAANDLLAGLFSDRDVATRVAAVTKYAFRVIEKGAPVGPLEVVLRAGARELVLPAAEGVASRGLLAALRPLLLVVRAGEAGERERALLSLGSLGDPRALEELEKVATGGTPEEPVDPSMQAAATEALGRIAKTLKDPEVRQRVIDRVEQAAADSPDQGIRRSAVQGLRWIGGERSRAKLEAILGDESVPEFVRSAAATQLGLLEDVAAEQALALALDRWEYGVRTEARKALDKLFPKDRTRVEFLAVDSQQSDISEPAAAYLANEGDPATLVKRLATLKNPALRQRLRYGLVRRGALPAGEVAALLGAEGPEARTEAAWLVGARTGAEGTAGSVPEDDRSLLVSALASSERKAALRWKAAAPKDRGAEAEAWSRALWAGLRLRAGEFVPVAAKVLAGGEAVAPAEVRRVAARVLGALGTAADVEVLSGALKDVDVGVREASARGLLALAPERAAALAVAVRPFDPVAFGATAARAEARAPLVGTDEGRRLVLPSMLVAKEVGPLVDLARDAKDAAAKKDAFSALGRVGGDDAMATLRAVAFDKKAGDADLRKAAFRALKRAQRAAARAKKMEARG